MAKREYWSFVHVGQETLEAFHGTHKERVFNKAHRYAQKLPKGTEYAIQLDGQLVSRGRSQMCPTEGRPDLLTALGITPKESK